MVGAISTLVDAAVGINKIAELGDQNLTSTLAQLNNTKSITERAKKALFIYPVLFSPGVTEIDLASKISKFLEIQYGIFTLMTVGLNPSVEDGNIANYLNSISAEGYEIGENIKAKIQNVNPDHVEIYYQDFQEENKGFFDPYICATEAFDGSHKRPEHQKKVADLEEEIEKAIKETVDLEGSDPETLKEMCENIANHVRGLDSINEHDKKHFEEQIDNIQEKYKKDHKNDKENKTTNEDIMKELNNIKKDLGKVKVSSDEYLNPLDLNDPSLSGNASGDKWDVIKAITKANPTMINLKVKIKGYDADFNIPIGLKANPHFVNQEDLSTLLDSAIEDKRVLTRLVRLTSGEISFFKDFIFNMDRIKRDQKLYARFGQHPWYRQFIQRKENNIFKKTAIVISGLFNKFKGVTSMTSNYLPTASLILTVDEIERGAKMKYGFLLKHEKIIWSILEHLGLLCVCIYNPELQTCSFYFNGFKKPLLVPISQMKSDNSDPNAEMAKVMNTMLKRGIM